MASGVGRSRASLVAGVAIVPVAAVALACVASLPSCGSSGAASGPTGDGGISYTAVVTYGGGVTSDGSGNPFAAVDAAADGPADGGSSPDADAGTPSGDDGGLDAPPYDGPPYAAPTCDGVNPCDLRSNTCCLMNGPSASVPLIGTCQAGATSTCANNQATVHCLQALECGGTRSCCGEILVLLGQVEANCLDLGGDGGLCPFAAMPTFSQIGVQLCRTDAECQNGQPCVKQTCMYGATLSMCGLQQDAGLLNCTPAP